MALLLLEESEVTYFLKKGAPTLWEGWMALMASLHFSSTTWEMRLDWEVFSFPFWSFLSSIELTYLMSVLPFL